MKLTNGKPVLIASLNMVRPLSHRGTVIAKVADDEVVVWSVYRAGGDGPWDAESGDYFHTANYGGDWNRMWNAARDRFDARRIT